MAATSGGESRSLSIDVTKESWAWAPSCLRNDGDVRTARS
jgi:hypothetical protein